MMKVEQRCFEGVALDSPKDIKKTVIVYENRANGISFSIDGGQYGAFFDSTPEVETISRWIRFRRSIATLLDKLAEAVDA